MFAQNSLPDNLIIEIGNAQGGIGVVNLGIHHHIRWTGGSSLDWKPFRTKQEATKVAEQIKKPGESYAIVERNDGCERCQEFKLKAFFAVTE
jgi:hypothetical protein